MTRERLLIGACLIIGLAGCSTTQTNDFDSMVSALNAAGCHVTVNVAASAGVANIGSGVQFQGSADCPGHESSTSSAPPATPAAAAEAPAPSPTVLH